jgi:hypothetical protein
MPSEPSATPGAPEQAEGGDARIRAALDSVAARIESYRSAVGVTADQLRGYLARGGQADATEASRAALGEFAVGRINAARLSQYVAATAPTQDDGWVGPVRRALETLEQLEADGDALFRVRVERGGDLRSTVEQALANAGRAFGAARLADLARSGRYEGEAHDALVASFPFRRWSSAERNLAPPLVVEVRGGDLQVAALADYLDGSQAFVLLVDGPAPPAPLARLLTPGVLAIQGEGEEALERIAEATVPTVVALLPSGAARFVHEPADGDGVGRLEVEFLPEDEPRRAIGVRSPFQQGEELRLLRLRAAAAPEAPRAVAESDATAPAAPAAASDNGAAPAPPAAPGDPVGTLAAWLLSRADLTNLDAEDN